MFDLILRLRARPLAYRRRVAFWSAVGVTALIVLVWGLSLSVRFDTTADASEASRVPTPFETFMKQVDAGMSSLKGRLYKNDF